MRIKIVVTDDDGRTTDIGIFSDIDNAIEELQGIKYQHEANQDYLTDGE